MILDEGIKHIGSPFVIPDSSRNDLPEFFVRRGYKVGAEIGVYRGEFTEKFCQVGLKMYAIDPWQAFWGQGRSARNQEIQDANYTETQQRLSPYNCTIMRETSVDAVKKFRNNSLDFVYIDGNHALPFIVEDIWLWSKKVRSGGIVSGHDYYCTPPHASSLIVHVAPAVDMIVRVTLIENYWIIDGKDYRPSWMWITK